ncbi:MAG: hypothetical protein IJ710_08980 [Prevotella sp.]|nr:hypothetical protein [Prevotella sp.]
MAELRNYWGVGNQVRLPRTIRAYFGVGAESEELSLDEKLLELGYCLWQGLNLYSAIKSYLENHAEYENDIRLGLANAIEYIRSNGTHQDWLTYTILTDGATVGGKQIKITLKQIVDLLSAELLVRYRPNQISQCLWNYKDILAKYDGMDLINKLTSPTSATDIPISEQEIRDNNPWSSLYEFINPIDDVFFDKDSNWLLKDDAYYIEKFNKKNQGDCEFITNLRPEPFTGNPLTSKVIVLTLNPGYICRANDMLARVMPPQITEVIKYQLNAQLCLRAKSFMCENTNTSWNVTYREAQNIIGDWYWYDIFENFRKEAGLSAEDSPEDVIYDNVSLVQYIGYFSKSYKALPAGVTLPSQRFTRLLVHYIALNKKNVLFVVSRSEKEWRGLIGEEIWNLLESENRLVHRKQFTNKNGTLQTIRTQEFTRNAFTADGFDRIVKTLQSF